MNKKILALLMAILMVVMSSVAMADTGVFTSADFLTLKKNYTLNGKTPTDIPEEELTFTATCIDVTDGETGADKETTAPTVTVDEKEAAVYEWTNAVHVTLGENVKAGLYKYEIAEDAGTEAGVTYDNSKFYVYVLVGPSADGYAIKTVYVNDGSAKKDDFTFVNTIDKLGSAKIKKTITGSLADTTAVFPVEVTIELPSGATSTANNMTITATGDIDNQATTVGDFVNGVSTTTVYVTHNTEIVINNIPEDATVEVKELEDGLTVDGIKYDDTYVGNEAVVVTGETKTIEITNTANIDNVPTGVFTDNMPYFMLMAFVMILAAAVVLKKRTVNE